MFRVAVRIHTAKLQLEELQDVDCKVFITRVAELECLAYDENGIIKIKIEGDLK